MRRHNRRTGNWRPGERTETQSQTWSAAEPGINPQPARHEHGKSHGRRGDSAKAADIVKKIVKVDWGEG